MTITRNAKWDVRLPAPSRECDAQATCAAETADTAHAQGLTLVHFSAQLEDLRDTSLTLLINLSTFGKRPRVTLGYMGDTVSSS